MYTKLITIGNRSGTSIFFITWVGPPA